MKNERFFFKQGFPKGGGGPTFGKKIPRNPAFFLNGAPYSRAHSNLPFGVLDSFKT